MIQGIELFRSADSQVAHLRLTSTGEVAANDGDLDSEHLHWRINDSSNGELSIMKHKKL